MHGKCGRVFHNRITMYDCLNRNAYKITKMCSVTDQQPDSIVPSI